MVVWRTLQAVVLIGCTPARHLGTRCAGFNGAERIEALDMAPMRGPLVCEGAGGCSLWRSKVNI